jgi:uncharacterized RDD family membrane protein YckC
MNTIAYPRLIRRIQAFLIDSVLVPVAVIGTLILGDALGVSQPSGKVLLLLGPVFILEPGLVALTGGTVGHHLQGIRVTRTGGASNINILAATIRFVVKLLLGWLSFIFVLTTARHQAVHDIVARSLVVHKDTSGLSSHEALPERMLDRAAYEYPPAWHRVAVIIAYAVLATVALSIASALVLSPECAHGRQCTTIGELLAIALNILWLVGLGWLTVRGWNGTLYGCKRRPRECAAQ